MNELLNVDCMEYMKILSNDFINLTLTDIPYGAVNRKSNGLQSLDKGLADIMTFNINDFLNEVYRISKSTIIIFCGKEQFSEIFKFFAEKQEMKKGTVRELIWEKSNPSPMNGQYVYLSGIENAVWFRKKGGTFNAHCKNTVFKFPLGSSKIHPTEKNHALLKDLILDNSNEGDIVFDPCAGSGSTLLVAKENNRQYLGCELYKEYYDKAKERL